MYQHAIICCARWETPYISEWIRYHDAIGFDKIYLYCNDDDPASLAAAVARTPKSRADLVDFVHVPEQGQQRKMYLDGLARARQKAEWVTFLAVDEFLRLGRHETVGAFMSEWRDRADSVHFQWLCFGNNGHVTRPSGSVLRTYTRRDARLHQNTKHITRASLLDGDKIENSRHPFWHGLLDPVWKDIRRVTVLGDDIGELVANYPTRLRAYLDMPEKREAILATAAINHYMIKSERDFLLRAERGLGGDFAGQAAWRDCFESGAYKQVLHTMNQEEDRFLRDVSKTRLTDPKPPKTAAVPASQPALRRVPVDNAAGSDVLVLGENGRLQRAGDGRLASYHEVGDLLIVYWDDHPVEAFLRNADRYAAAVPFSKDVGNPPQGVIDPPASDAIDPRRPMRVALGSATLPVATYEVEISGYPTRVHMRPGGSDADVFRDIFVDKKYDNAGMLVAPRVIVDLGANIGLSSVAFALQFPEARIFAVEPEPGNYAMLLRNAAPFPNITPIWAAAWPTDTVVDLVSEDAAGVKLGEWGYQTVAGSDMVRRPVRAISLARLFDEQNITFVDLLKIDVEGAEREIFSGDLEGWLPHVACIMVETHPHLREGADQIVSQRLAADFSEQPPSGNYRVFCRKPVDASVAPPVEQYSFLRSFALDEV